METVYIIDNNSQLGSKSSSFLPLPLPRLSMETEKLNSNMNYGNCWSSRSMLSFWLFVILFHSFFFLLLDFSALCRLGEATHPLLQPLKCLECTSLARWRNSMPFGGTSKPISTDGSGCILVPSSPSLWISVGMVVKPGALAGGARMFIAP